MQERGQWKQHPLAPPLSQEGPRTPERQHTTGPTAIKWAAPTPNGIQPTLMFCAFTCVSSTWTSKHDSPLFCSFTDAFSLTDRFISSFPVTPSVLALYITNNSPIINQLNLHLSISLIEMHFTEPHLYHWHPSLSPFCKYDALHDSKHPEMKFKPRSNHHNILYTDPTISYGSSVLHSITFTYIVKA